MSKYFSNFPKTFYIASNNSTSLETITNLTVGFSLDKTFSNNSILYYEYTIRDGDTPENLSHKIYGSSEYHWIIMKMNDIVDIKNDWPLDQETLIKCIEEKYANNASPGDTGFDWARETTHSYYKIETQSFPNSTESKVIKTRIDSNTYANLTSSTNQYTLPDNSVLKIDVAKSFITYYDYEVQENEAKRQLKIMKPEYINPVYAEFQRVMK